MVASLAVAWYVWTLETATTGPQDPLISSLPHIQVNLAGFQIHSAIHKARPEVQAICHSHSVYGKAFSALGKPVRPANLPSSH
mgnify:CR=1 FL=1